MRATTSISLRLTLAACGLVIASVSTGCQTHMGGQMLPSPWYHFDDVQYFAPGPEFKLSREAAAAKAYKAERALEERTP